MTNLIVKLIVLGHWVLITPIQSTTDPIDQISQTNMEEGELFVLLCVSVRFINIWMNTRGEPWYMAKKCNWKKLKLMNLTCYCIYIGTIWGGLIILCAFIAFVQNSTVDTNNTRWIVCFFFLSCLCSVCELGIEVLLHERKVGAYVLW